MQTLQCILSVLLEDRKQNEDNTLTSQQSL